MRVKIDENNYIVNFQTEAFSSKEVENEPSKELHKVTCKIYRYNPRTKEKALITDSVVVQNYKDKTNDVLGRKIAFTRALGQKTSMGYSFFYKNERIAFWNEYKRTARYVVK
jgi:hypothetical protein